MEPLNVWADHAQLAGYRPVAGYHTPSAECHALRGTLARAIPVPGNHAAAVGRIEQQPYACRVPMAGHSAEILRTNKAMSPYARISRVWGLTSHTHNKTWQGKKGVGRYPTHRQPATHLGEAISGEIPRS